MPDKREAADTRRGASPRYELARRATLRNIAVASLIAVVVCAAVLVVAARWGRNLPDEMRPGRKLAGGRSDPEQHYSLSGEKLVHSTPEMRRKTQEYMASQGVLEGFDPQAFQEQLHISVSNVLYVERGKGWDHAIVIMPGDKLYHVYTFTYSCGHNASVTPDPARDLMYEQPELVQSRYSSELCRDCKSMRRSLDQGAIGAPKGGK